MRFPFFLAKALAQILVLLAFLAVIVTGLFAAVILAICFNRHGVPLSSREMRFSTEGLAAFAGSLAAAWLSVRFQRRLVPNALRYQQPSRQTQSNISKFSTFFAGLVLASLIFLKTKESGLEKVLFTAAAFVLVGLGLHLLIFVHECGHLAFGWFAGFKLQKLQVGKGRLIARKMLRSGFIWEWRLWPAGGIVIGWPDSDAPARLRKWFFIAGGPLASVLAVAALFAPFCHDPLHSASTGWAFTVNLAGAVVLMMAAGMLIGALVPHTFPFAGMQIQSDGGKLLALLRPPKVAPIEIKWARRWRQLSFFWASHQRERAWSLLRESIERDVELRDRLEFVKGWFHFGVEEYHEAVASFEIAQANAALPGDLRLAARAHLAFCLAGVGKTQDAHSLIAAVLTAAPEKSKVNFLDFFASLPSIIGASELLADARKWVAEAIQLDPKLIRLRVTEAALLMERGEMEKAEPVLRKIIDGDCEETDRGIAAFYLALFLKHRNANKPEIVRWTKRAAAWCPQIWLLRRIRTDLEPVESATPRRLCPDLAA